MPRTNPYAPSVGPPDKCVVAHIGSAAQHLYRPVLTAAYTVWCNVRMDLKTYLSPMSQEVREEFAGRCGTSRGHLQNVSYGYRPCATDLAVLIERESKYSVRRWELRPDDWHKHWPELIGTEGAPAVPEEKAVA